MSTNAGTSCTIHVSVFRAAPFELAWGSSVWAKVIAINAYGDAASALTPARIGGEPARFVALKRTGVTTTAAVVATDVGVLGDRLCGLQVRLAIGPHVACTGASTDAASARCRWQEPFGARRNEREAARRQLLLIDEAKHVGVPACQDGHGLAKHDSVPAGRETEARVGGETDGHRARQKPMLVTLACGFALSIE